ncbi:hypothetical protein Leryth_012208 [Lithospermum erythrorhizon]|nr:hypothetical protein Leryth_012208 [Lithospermum erythrorhizon]
MSEDGEDSDSEMEYVNDESYGSDKDGEEDEDENDGDDTPSTDESSDDEPLLNHARQVYSEKSFCIFKHEYKKSLALSVDDTRDNDDVFEYEVKLGHFNTHRRVLAFFYEQVVTCSCNYFSVTGILCCHALYILQCMRIDQIPEHYLLKWRMKSEILATKLSVIKAKNHKQGRCSSDDNFPNKSINRSLHEKKFEEHYTSATEDDEGKDEDYSDDAQVGAPLLRHAKEI